MRRDLLPVLYAWVAGIGGNVSSPGTSPQRTQVFAARNYYPAKENLGKDWNLD